MAAVSISTEDADYKQGSITLEDDFVR